jgi:hypothetical protein
MTGYLTIPGMEERPNRVIKRWRDRADECRALAADMRNEEARSSLLDTAERCERMADHVEQKNRKKDKAS